MVANISAYDSVLLTLYPQKKMIELAERAEPFLGMIEMKTDFGGKERQIGRAHV